MGRDGPSSRNSRGVEALAGMCAQEPAKALTQEPAKALTQEPAKALTPNLYVGQTPRNPKEPENVITDFADDADL